MKQFGSSNVGKNLNHTTKRNPEISFCSVYVTHLINLLQIKFGSVKLAKKYMRRVAVELQSKGASDKDPALDYMLLQGVRFAFRIHQFAGGFDADTMHAFEELRNLACPK
ncbi:protein CHUP1, chloroplastic-like [Telopea speciosissima]|uniref:protein CHUP1, chloroplastic-like n=1 Tax=Telopea speciosissima TaxID=54955 RepID=UPI001CC7351C|nr:protein CHUP1, chloroplastic-like [Telopea speciosissima]